MDDVEALVNQYGEKYRKLIEDAARFLESHERDWNLDKPINRAKFFRELIEEAKMSE